jgi:hypothetical protein
MKTPLDKLTVEEYEALKKQIISEHSRQTGAMKRGVKERYSLAKTIANRYNGKKGGRPKGTTGYGMVDK